MLDPDLLRTFVAIADTGSFTEAAGRVHRTQSAVSMQMKRLEEVTGRRLFEKSGRGVMVSREGEMLLPHARRLLRAHQDVMAVLEDTCINGRVRLGAPDDYASTYLPVSLARFAGTHPRVEVELVVRPSCELVRELDEPGGVDLAVITQGNGERDGITLVREPLVWVTSARHDAHLRDPLPLAVFHGECVFREAMLESLAGLGRNSRLAYSSLSIAGIYAALAAGLAVSGLLRPTVQEGFRILTEREGFPPLPSFGVSLVRSKVNRSAASDALANHVMDSFCIEMGSAAA